jgi:hypothetical protein
MLAHERSVFRILNDLLSDGVILMIEVSLVKGGESKDVTASSD